MGILYCVFVGCRYDLMSFKLSLSSQHDCLGSCWWDSGAISKVGSSKSSRAGNCTGALHLPYTTVQELKF